MAAPAPAIPAGSAWHATRRVRACTVRAATVAYAAAILASPVRCATAARRSITGRPAKRAAAAPGAAQTDSPGRERALLATSGLRAPTAISAQRDTPVRAASSARA
jgi:hypothetical protein